MTGQEMNVNLHYFTEIIGVGRIITKYVEVLVLETKGRFLW